MARVEFYCAQPGQNHVAGVFEDMGHELDELAILQPVNYLEYARLIARSVRYTSPRTYMDSVRGVEGRLATDVDRLIAHRLGDFAARAAGQNDAIWGVHRPSVAERRQAESRLRDATLASIGRVPEIGQNEQDATLVGEVRGSLLRTVAQVALATDSRKARVRKTAPLARQSREVREPVYDELFTQWADTLVIGEKLHVPFVRSPHLPVHLMSADHIQNAFDEAGDDNPFALLQVIAQNPNKFA